MMENVAAKFAADGNFDNMKDGFKRILEPESTVQTQASKHQRGGDSYPSVSRAKAEANLSNSVSRVCFDNNRGQQESYYSTTISMSSV